MATERTTRRVTVGGVPLGGGAPVVVQSMTDTDTADVETTLAQIDALADAGCEIVRVAVPTARVLEPLERLCADSPLPVVADIHFDHRLAIEAARRGASKLRINPGNVGSLERVDAIIEAAGEAGIPIRIGVNSGSLAPSIAESDLPLSEKLAAGALAFLRHFEDRGFDDVVVSAKASSVDDTVAAYRLLARETDAPLHVGVTEAGTGVDGIVKSAVGIGILLEEGIGDTIRVSLTGDPVQELRVAWRILSSLDLRRRSPEIVSCPTCGRCGIDLAAVADEVSRRLEGSSLPIKVAVMGCEVNGPGEARDADVGVAAGKGSAAIFRHGVIVRRVSEDDIVEALMDEVTTIERERPHPADEG